MKQFEYKVVPAPAKGRKAPGVKTPEARFALGLEDVMNELAAEGWHYLRSDLLPSEERQGLTSSQTVYRSVLVFQRPKAEGPADAVDVPVTEAVIPPEPVLATPAPAAETLSEALDVTDEPAMDVDPLPPRNA